MSACGTKRTSLVALHMSALGGKAVITNSRFDVSGPECCRLFGVIIPGKLGG